MAQFFNLSQWNNEAMDQSTICSSSVLVTRHSLNKEKAMAEFDTIIKDGMIVDGTLVPPYKADLAIKDGKIAKIGRLQSSDAKQVLDASGLIVAPGAVDLHAHYDAPLHWDP